MARRRWSRSATIRGMKSLRGQLLVASPAIEDPNFRRSVVLIGHHDADGALGVVINRPTGTTLAEAAPPVAEMTGDGELELFVGGPVMSEAVVVIAEFEDPSEAAMLAFGSVGLLSTVSDPDSVDRSTRRIRAFAGHAGWSGGQLDDEMEREDWIVAPATADLVFTEEPGDLWAGVLADLGGTYELLARMPDDPSVN